MGLIADFNKLHISIKSIILSILATIPFIFISIFIFKHTLIDKIDTNPLTDFDFYFLLSLCFSLSLNWVISNIVLSIVMSSLADSLTQSNSGDAPFIITFFNSVYYFSIAILLNYYYFNFSTFTRFILLSYSILLCRLLITILGWGMVKIFR